MRKNCFRCGKEFEAVTNERICKPCTSKSTSVGEPKGVNGLSFREIQVMRLVAQGLQNKEIAYELHLATGTIKEYLNRIFRKLEITNRVELTLWSIRHEMEVEKRIQNILDRFKERKRES